MSTPEARQGILFGQFKAAEPPDWLPLLPVPGQYRHPWYGQIDLSSERLASFAAGVNSAVFLPKLPVNAEHYDDTAGALGWIVEARQNADGSIDGRVDWTDRGVEAIRADRFMYVSPEWHDTWEDALGAVHEDVLVGAAVCVRPFFKPPYLRPLAATDPATGAASEATGWFQVSPPPAEAGTTPPEVSMSDTAQAGAGAAPQPTAAVDPAAFKAMSDRLTAVESELTATKAAKESSDTALRQATETITTMQSEMRRTRFTDEVMGKSDANGHMWAGEVAKNVSVLETLADSVGEDSEVFKDFVAQQRATAEQLKQSGLFKEFGSASNGAAGGGSAWARIEAEAKKIATDEKVGFSEAVGLVAKRQPQLYAEYQTEQRRAAKEA